MAGGLTICTEVQKRLGGRFILADIVPYANRIMNLVVAANPSAFLQTKATALGVTNSQIVASVLDTSIDIGKPIHISHRLTGVPIPKIVPNLMIYPATGSSYSFKGIGTTNVYNGWMWTRSGSLPAFLFLPFLSPASVDIQFIYYLMASPLVSGSDNPTTPWSTAGGPSDLTWIDDIVIDGTEAEIKRVSNYVGWQILEERFKARVMEVKNMFNNERENTGDLTNNQITEAEKTNLGRV